MRHHPILMAAEMVCATLDDRKTQTRRIINPQPTASWMENTKQFSRNGSMYDLRGRQLYWLENPEIGTEIRSRYGKPGDILWVRETFNITSFRNENRVVSGTYIANGKSFTDKQLTVSEWGKFDKWNKKIGGKPSLFMFRSLSRIEIEITDIRVEQLQDISQEDAQAEGVFQAPHRCPGWKNELLAFKDCFICSYKLLWNQLNGESGFGWEANPWVWVISFKRINQPLNTAACN